MAILFDIAAKASNVFAKVILAVMLVSTNPMIAQDLFAKMDAFQLSAPKVDVDSILFVDSAIVSVTQGESGSTTFYEMDGEQQEYGAPVVLNDSKAVSFWSEHPNYQKSDVQITEVVKINRALAEATLKIAPQPNDAYKGQGLATLNNLVKGTTSFRNEQEWLGFQNESVTIEIDFENPTQISLMRLGILLDHGSWIFYPKRITVLSQGEIIGNKVLEIPEEAKNSRSTFVSIAIEPNQYETLEVVVKALEGIPEWHAGRGTMPWTFIDELLIEN